MKKVFIDVGAFTGDTIRLFLQGEFTHDDPRDYEMVAFEPDARHHDGLYAIAKEHPALHIIPAAAWLHGDGVDFAVPGDQEDMGASVMRSKRVWQDGQVLRVPSVDFPAWLEQYRGAYVVVKMDVEGAEFPILEALLASGGIDIIAKLFVEFHANKVPEYTSTYCNELIAQLRVRTNLIEWH